MVALRLKGYNNGLYLDNILDTNLHLFKPKSKKKIKMEIEKKCKTLNYLYNIKTFSNEKILHSTKCSFDKFFKKNQVYSLKNLKFNKSKKKPSLINLKSLSIKHENNVKKFFKTNIPLDDERIIFDKIQKKF